MKNKKLTIIIFVILIIVIIVDCIEIRRLDLTGSKLLSGAISEVELCGEMIGYQGGNQVHHSLTKNYLTDQIMISHVE